jgi:hypothetical protein
MTQPRVSVGGADKRLRLDVLANPRLPRRLPFQGGATPRDVRRHEREGIWSSATSLRRSGSTLAESRLLDDGGAVFSRGSPISWKGGDTCAP